MDIRMPSLERLRELKDLLAVTKTAYDTVKFYLYRLGRWCNAAKSVSFTDAECDLHCIDDAECQLDKGKDSKTKPLEIGLNVLYKKGFLLLRKVFSSDSAKDEDFDEPSKGALQTFMDFITNKRQHIQSLEKILKAQKNEEDVAAVIAQHFLGKLGPAEEFFIDSRYKGNTANSWDLCKCGCNAVIKSRITGIGNEEVWHGFLDIAFESHGELLVGASVAKRARLDTEGGASGAKRARLDTEGGASVAKRARLDTEGGASIAKRARLDTEGEDGVEADDVTDENLSCSPDGGNGVEDKVVENEAAAQAICFSILQRNRHPEFKNSLIPFIAISSSEVIIFMYDAVNDIFVRSPNMPIFSSYSKDINLKTMLTVWMIMHYKYFCSGIPLKDLSFSLEYVKSGFSKHIENCGDKYNSVNSIINDFKPVVGRGIIGDILEKYECTSLIDCSKIDTFEVL